MRHNAIPRVAIGLAVLTLAAIPALAQAQASAAGAPYSITVDAQGIKHLKLAQNGPVLTPSQKRAALLNKLPMIGSSLLQAKLAEHLGLTNIGGKALASTVAKRGADAQVSNEIDDLVSGDSLSILGQQTEPSIAVNPVDPNIVVVAGHNTNNYSGVSNACSVYISYDGGRTYTYDSDLPLNQPTPFCSDAVVRFSPDGATLYATYLDINSATFDDSVRLLLYDGFNPSGGPLGGWLASATAPDLYDKEWIDVHTWDATGAGAGKVYWTWTAFVGSSCDIYEATFSNHGFTNDAVNFPLAASGPCASPRLLQGSRPAAGPGPEVLVCWYDSGPDGWSTGAQVVPPAPPNPVIPLNKFNIACRTSNDRGLTFAGGTANPETVAGNWLYAGKDIKNEIAYYMGPNANYFRYSGGQFPSLAIDHLGTAHVVVGFNPGTGNRFKSEQGNVAYLKAPLAAPAPFLYPKWTKTNAASGFGAQFFPTVVAQKAWESAKPLIYIGWLDTSSSNKLGAANANLVYDVRYKLSKAGGAGFGKPVLVSEHASLSDFSFIGDYIDSSATQSIYQIVWTDNRLAQNIFSPREHFFSDRY